MLSLSSRAGRAAKRVVDLTASIIGLVILIPVFAVIAVAIKLDTTGPVFFRQVRVGRGSAPFRIWKFRSMVHNATGLGLGVTTDGDARITRVGRVLRARKLDELPQLINVLVGEMSLVGPRPETPEYVAHYRPDETVVLDVRPGITDPASIRYRDEEEVLGALDDPLQYYKDVLMHEKIALNLEYQGRASALSDVLVVFRTIFSIAAGTRRENGPKGDQQG